MGFIVNKKTIIKVIGGVFIVLGIIIILLKGFLPETIDSEGIIHENFFLLPLGFSLVFIGIISFIISSIL